MFIATWIIVVAGIIAFILFIAWLTASAEFNELKEKSFIPREVKSVKFQVEITYFSPSSKTFASISDLNQLELMLETSHYGKSGVFDQNAFDKLGANMGFYHIVFNTLAPTTT